MRAYRAGNTTKFQNIRPIIFPMKVELYTSFGSKTSWWKHIKEFCITNKGQFLEEEKGLCSNYNQKVKYSTNRVSFIEQRVEEMIKNKY